MDLSADKSSVDTDNLPNASMVLQAARRTQREHPVVAKAKALQVG